MADTSGWLRPVFAPAVPENARRDLSGEPDPSPLPVVLAALVGVVFGLAGIAVIVSGGHPRDADPVVFQAVAGGGSLLVAVLALIACVRTAAGQRATRRAYAQWSEQVVAERELATIAADVPEIGAILRQAFQAIDDIRESGPYRDGWLNSVLDAAALDGAEWSIAVEARRAHRAGAMTASLTGQANRLSELRSAVRRLADDIDEQQTKDLLARTLTDRPDDRPAALAAVDELSHFLRRNG
ncbi:hypothetical protein [Fodinicola acaciae]|uniref:hypothetical protein n=1 Tax=Fodinicola acaciae TaxID=2681555 RepID=UPI0013D898A7|nr:hypothetical protein [Fodinicola acaciae]